MRNKKEKSIIDRDFVRTVEKQTDERIETIKAMEDASSRLAAYNELSANLSGFFSGQKPERINSDSAMRGYLLGGSGGAMGALLLCSALIPGAGPLVGLGIVVGGVALGAGGAGGMAGLFSEKSRARSAHLRENYGSVGNAKKLYKIQAKVKGLIAEEQKNIEVSGRNAGFKAKLESIGAHRFAAAELEEYKAVTRRLQAENALLQQEKAALTTENGALSQAFKELAAQPQAETPQQAPAKKKAAAKKDAPLHDWSDISSLNK